MEYDSTTGQYYDDSRWYSAGVGRFDSLDPEGFAPGDPDLYRYVGNNSTDAVDFTGFSEDDGGSQASQQGALLWLKQKQQDAQQEQQELQDHIKAESYKLETMRIAKDVGIAIEESQFALQLKVISVLELQLRTAMRKEAAAEAAYARVAWLGQLLARSNIRAYEIQIDEKRIKAGREAADAQQEGLGNVSENQTQERERLKQQMQTGSKAQEQMFNSIQLNDRFLYQQYINEKLGGSPAIWPAQNPDNYPYPPGYGPPS